MRSASTPATTTLRRCGPSRRHSSQSGGRTGRRSKARINWKCRTDCKTGEAQYSAQVSGSSGARRTFCCQTALGCRTQTPSPPGSPGTKPQKKAAATQKRTLFKPRRRIPTGRRRIRPWPNAPFSGCIGGCGPQGRQGPVDCELHIVIQETWMQSSPSNCIK